MTQSHDSDSPVSLQVNDMLSNPLVKETAAALTAQGITPASQDDLDDDEQLNALAQAGGLDPVTASLSLIARSESNEDKKAGIGGMPQEVAEALQLADSLKNLDPFEMLPVLLENGKPWAVKMALMVFEQGVMMMAFNSTPNVDRINQEIGDAALTVMDGLAEQNRWKGVPDQMMSRFIDMMERGAQENLGGKAMGRALKASLAQLKDAMDDGSTAAPAAPAAKKKPGGFDF